MILWGDLDARARGLETRLPTREGLARLAASADRAELDRALHEILGLRETTPPRTPERAVRDAMAERIDLLRTWAGPDREGALRVVFEDEDRRSVRRLLRGAAQGAPAEARLAGLVPTPTLPAATLEALARERSPERVAEGLSERDHPYGPPLVERIEAGPFDLFSLEVGILRTFAERALESAAADARLEAHVRETIDLANAWAGLLSGSFTADIDADSVFVDGGVAIDRATYGEAARIDDVERSREAIARAFRSAGSSLWRPFADRVLDPSRLEPAVLAARIDALHDLALRDPLSPAPLLKYVLRLRALALDLRRIVWGIALGAPASIVGAEWVTDR